MTKSETFDRSRGVGGIFVLLTRVIRLSAAKAQRRPGLRTAAKIENNPSDILAKDCCSHIAWSQVMRKYAFVGILALVVLSGPSDSRRAIADEVNPDYSALKDALLDGKDIHTLIDLSMCRVHGTDKSGPPVRGVSHFDGYMIQADGSIAFARTHFTVRPDKTPVNEFLSYRLSASGKVEHHTIFLNAATFAVLHEAEFDCEIGKGVTFHW